MGARTVGLVQMHLSQHTVSFIQNYPRSLTVPRFRPTVFATVLLIVQHAILPLTSLFFQIKLFVYLYPIIRSWKHLVVNEET